MFHRSIELTLIFLWLTVAVILLWACSPKKTAKPAVAVSILPQRWIMKQLVGDRLDVQVMVPPGTSPEAYDPAPGDLMRLSRSAAYFMVGGLGFERAWMPRFSEQNPTMPFFDTSMGLERLADDYGHDVDPHIWTTPRNLAGMARNMCDALCRVFPADSALFVANCDALLRRLDEMDERIRRQLAISRARTFIIYHPALSYFAHDYGLHQIAVERDHKEPSAAMMQALVDEVCASDARVLLMQQEYDARLVETLAQETGVRVVRVSLLSEDFETELMRIVLEITR